MERHNRIHWVKGLDITPEIFIEADNYHVAERSLLGRFFASRLYGILSERKFHIRKRIDTYTFTLFIDDLECLAITSDGYVINIQKDTPFNKEVSLKEAIGKELYVVLKVNPYTLTPVDEKELYVGPKYNFVLKRMEETIENGIPVLKIYYDNDKQCWEIDNTYIPPSIALNSVDILKEQYYEIKDKLNHIVEKLPEDDMTCMQTLFLKWELDNYCLQESPQELTLLLKKICWMLKLYLKSAKRMEELPGIKRFIEEQYNPNDIGKILHLGFESLIEIDQKIGEKPKEVVVPTEIEEIIV